MKTLTQITLIGALALFVSGLSAQVVYKDLNPDSVLNMPAETGGKMHLDFDGDNVDDVKLNYTNYQSFGIWNLGFDQIDGNNPKVEILVDHSIPQSTIGDYYVKQLSMSDAVNSSGNYSSNYPQVADIYNNNFLGVTGKYVGFRILVGSDYKYGWMAVEIQGSASFTFTITEFAYQNTVNTPINAGEAQGIGIEHYELNKLVVNTFPNPATDYLNVELEDQDDVIEAINIYSLDGKLIKTFNEAALSTKLYVGELEAGVYVLEVQGERTSSKKMIVKG